MKELISLAQQLIACPSVTPDDAGCQTIIMERLAKHGFTCETMSFNDVTNLWARYGTEAPLFVFAGHTDVVPPGPLSDWTSPPFTAEIRDGYLYGRGACDMKGAVAAMVIAAEHFVQENPHFKGSLAFLLTSDEEAQAIDGTKRVLEVLKEREIIIDYCVVGEPSSDTLVGDQIRIGRRGSLHGQLTIHGKQGHVAHPHLANNPIHLCLTALAQLAKTTWDEGNELFPATTFQITNVHSGTGAANVIPGHVDALFNFRFGTASTIETLQTQTAAILQQHGLTFDLKWHLGAEPFVTKKSTLIDATCLAIKEITQLTTKCSTGGGTSDGRFIAKSGAKVVELGPCHTTAHQINECIRVDDLMTLVSIYRKLLGILLR